MWATRTFFAESPKVLQWETEAAALGYASRMRDYGYVVVMWKLP